MPKLSHRTEGRASAYEGPPFRWLYRLDWVWPALAADVDAGRYAARLSLSSTAPRTIAGMLGMHFAITSEQERLLLAADDSDTVGELLEEIEESWDDGALKVDTDKAWDAIHRSLTDGTLDPDGGVYPLSHAVLGGRHLHDDYYVVYVSAAEVRDVADALRVANRPWLRRRYGAIDDPDYDGSHDDGDFEYTWDNFVDVQAFYDRAAAAERAVIFTAI